METITANMPAELTNNARNYSGEKELVNRLQLVVFRPSEKKGTDDRHDQRFVRAIDARFWMGRSSQASTVYCSVWIYQQTTGGGFDYHGGTGSAGGFGYHKESAALDEALRSAGVTLSTPIHGAGDHAMEAALRAVARAAGYGRSPQVLLG